jgi:hypothetical protein
MTGPRITKPKKLKLTPPHKRLVLPDGPYLLGERRDVTPAGLQLIEVIAANGGGQPAIAAKLGMPKATFLKRCNVNDGDNECRLAFERGKAALDFEMATLLLNQAREGNTLAMIYFSKARLGWTDTPQPQQTVGIQIVVPDSLSREQYAARQLPQVTVIEAPKPPVMEKYVPDPEPEPIFTPAGYEQ